MRSMRPERLVKGGKSGAIKHLRRSGSPVPTDPFQEPETETIQLPEWFSVIGDVDVSIIVPLYKSKNVIGHQIKSWDLVDDGLRKEVIYIDDCCPDNSYAEVMKHWDQRKHTAIGTILRNKTNAGFGGACNAAAKFAHGKYLIFLNADCVVTPNWIRPMYDRMEADPAIGIVGNLHIKNIGGVDTIDSAGSEWNGDDFPHIGRHTYNRKPIPNPLPVNNAPREILTPGEREMVTGACFMISKPLFDEIRGFDVRYRIGYWEDTDLNFRVREKGYKIFFEPQSRIYHAVGHSGSGGHPWMQANREMFYNRWIYNGKINSLTNGPKANYGISKIYLRRRHACGDVLAAASVAAALKKQFPLAQITFETAIPELVKNNPYIDEVVPWTGSHVLSYKDNYSLIYDLDWGYELYRRKPIQKAFADIVGVPTEDCVLYLHPESVPFRLPQRYVVLYAGRTNWAGRNWIQERWIEITKRLVASGHYVVSVGGRNDYEIPDASLDCRGKTTFGQLATIIQGCSAYVGIDSLPLWVAQAFSKPGVAFFGSVDPATILVNDKILPVRDETLSCLGCHHNNRIPASATHECRLGKLFCEHNLTTEMMWEAVKKVLEIN